MKFLISFRYLDNFSEMYHLYDQSVDHRNKLDEIVVIMDCHLDSLDVAVGLTLQWQTPFRFMAQKVRHVIHAQIKATSAKTKQ